MKHQLIMYRLLRLAKIEKVTPFPRVYEYRISTNHTPPRNNVPFYTAIGVLGIHTAFISWIVHGYLTSSKRQAKVCIPNNMQGVNTSFVKIE